MVLHPDFISKPIAHRGLHDVVNGVAENSATAFERAIKHGYGIELDVQVSSDAKAMVFHDPDLLRLTGQTGLVREKPASALSKIALVGNGDKVPSLAEVLEQVAGQVPVLIEIKDQDGRLGPNVGKVAHDIAGLLECYQGPVAVMSYNPHAVAAVAELAPSTCIGLVTGAFRDSSWDVLPRKLRDHMAMISDFDRIGAGFVSHNQNNLENSSLLELKSRNIPIVTWTIRSKEQEVAARKVADNITFEDYLA